MCHKSICRGIREVWRLWKLRPKAHNSLCIWYCTITLSGGVIRSSSAVHSGNVICYCWANAISGDAIMFVATQVVSCTGGICCTGASCCPCWLCIDCWCISWRWCSWGPCNASAALLHHVSESMEGIFDMGDSISHSLLLLPGCMIEAEIDRQLWENGDPISTTAELQSYYIECFSRQLRVGVSTSLKHEQAEKLALLLAMNGQEGNGYAQLLS
mmetsp:Transcript_38291/g.95233  ORF Transcript_38291/g.95233 Transcript_38291/m.95233 type:complete len:214 (+) Transcript_38291:496-1137(+)